jgi:hypothetical protein
MNGATILLAGLHTRMAACEAVRQAPTGFVVRIEAPARTLDQSAKFYALCSQVAQSTETWDGERQSKRAWHDLLLHAWMLATDRKPRLVEGLNGGRVSLLMGTRDMTKGEMSELLDFSTAWAVSHGIEVVTGEG